MIQVLKLNASCLKIVTHYQLPRIRWSIWNEQIWICLVGYWAKKLGACIASHPGQNARELPFTCKTNNFEFEG